MLPNISKQIIEDILNNYLRQGLVAFLINHPQLGVGEMTNSSQFQRRWNLTMEEAVNYEVLPGNGYKRYIFDSQAVILRETFGLLELLPEWGPIDGPIGPCTHLCIARGANTFGASPGNGNNRGDYQGVLIVSQPLGAKDLNGMIIEPPVILKCRVPIKLLGRTL